MTISFTKKEVAYWIAIGLLLVLSSASFLAYKAAAQEDVSGLDSKSDQTAEATFEDGIPTGETNIPHLNCSNQINYTSLPTSDTYKANAPYAHTFMSDGLSIQDINGDNLPDYIFTDSENTISGTILIATSVGCTYLNNGSGWDRAYICYAKTRSDITTGVIDLKEYRGDCADTTSAGE